jgi:hypothetical protein
LSVKLASDNISVSHILQFFARRRCQPASAELISNMPESLFDKSRRAIHSLRRRTIGDRHVAAYYWAKSKFKNNAGKVWVYPDGAAGSSIDRVCAQLGLKITRTMSPDVLIGLYYDDDTFIKPPPQADFRILNANCLDISKSRVEQVFHEVFGYPLAINPLTYSGRAVCKSNLNAKHDGSVIDCPIEKTAPGRVYEKLIDNAVSDYLVEDIRLVLVGKQLPVAYLKTRFIPQRFSNYTRSARRVPLDSVISRSEQELILQFASKMHVDWAELDAMRDRKDGRLYIVDVNKTPGGPPSRMPFFPKIAAVRLVAAAFHSEFIASPTPYKRPDSQRLPQQQQFGRHTFPSRP